MCTLLNPNICTVLKYILGGWYEGSEHIPAVPGAWLLGVKPIYTEQLVTLCKPVVMKVRSLSKSLPMSLPITLSPCLSCSSAALQSCLCLLMYLIYPCTDLHSDMWTSHHKCSGLAPARSCLPVPALPVCWEHLPCWPKHLLQCLALREQPVCITPWQYSNT